MHLGLIAEHGVAVVEVEVSAAGVHALDDRALVVLDDVAKGFLGLGLDMVEVAEGDGRPSPVWMLPLLTVLPLPTIAPSPLMIGPELSPPTDTAPSGRRGLVAKGEVAGLES